MLVSCRLQQYKVKLLHNFMQHKKKGRFKKGRGLFLSVIMQYIESLVSYLIFSLKIHSP